MDIPGEPPLNPSIFHFSGLDCAVPLAAVPEVAPMATLSAPPVDITNLKDREEQLREQNERHRIMLETANDAFIGMDSHRLQQILINLIGNALKFTEHGSITLRVEADPAGAPGWLRFTVLDTGIGIAPDKTEMIFDRFSQADSSTARKYGGTGLGLAISRVLVERMGGQIACTSELGKGSTFVLSAPFGIRPADEFPEPATPVRLAAQPEIPAPPPKPFRILIAEDAEFNAALIKAYLGGSGYHLDFAENGQVAVEKVISGRPHLVLMDIQMPVMDGLEAARAIRQWEAQTNVREIPILALTAHAAAEGVQRSLEAGCSEHLTKPIKKTALLDAISRHLVGKIRITPPGPLEVWSSGT